MKRIGCVPFIVLLGGCASSAIVKTPLPAARSATYWVADERDSTGSVPEQFLVAIGSEESLAEMHGRRITAFLCAAGRDD